MSADKADNAENEPYPDELADAFFAVAHALRRFSDARFRDTKLSMARLKVLRELTEGATRIGELSVCLDVAARTMTSTVNGLERDGLVKRRPDPVDGRATMVAITPRGRRVYQGGWAIRTAAMGELCAVLDGRERAQLMAVLDKLGAAVDASMGAGESEPEPVSRA
jgi:DNA-binding MarR family transcriptional regulator